MQFLDTCATQKCRIQKLDNKIAKKNYENAEVLLLFLLL